MTALYFGMESLNLTAGQRQTLVAELQTLGIANNSPFPNLRNHSRVRADNLAVIFEADFNEATITIAAIKARLATIFNVAVGTITHSVIDNAFGKVITFIQGGQNRIRMVCFGMSVAGAWPSWAVSNAAARAYLAANSAAWGDSV
jgi:hypothetical protein